jgi:acyl carrier protein
MDIVEGRERLRQFVVNSLGNPNLTDSDDIFEVGNATSLFSLELLIFIEESLGIPLDDDDLQRENFSTIMGMTKMIERKIESP